MDIFLGLVGCDNIYARGKVEQGQQWIRQLDWDPAEIVLVGDTLHDFEVAEAMGSDCILLAHGHHCPTRLEQTGAPVAHSLGDSSHTCRRVQQFDCVGRFTIASRRIAASLESFQSPRFNTPTQTRTDEPRSGSSPRSSPFQTVHGYRHRYRRGNAPRPAHH